MGLFLGIRFWSCVGLVMPCRVHELLNFAVQTRSLQERCQGGGRKPWVHLAMVIS